MGKKHKQVSEFRLEGRFLGFAVEDGYKIKWLNLRTADGEHCIKLSKEARASVGRVLMPGDWVQVTGEKVVYLDTEEIKFKADRITTSGVTPSSPAPTSEKATKPAAKATIAMCQKSDCMKRGGKAVCQALAATLSDRGLTDQVTVKGTGCMKQCKAGPNLVMPNKQRYSRITAKEIPALIDKHFPPAPAADLSNPASAETVADPTELAPIA
ncbi:(2Fe-2S) ferredoxin domain-containing protein [Pantanalinema rosaneae CENA516]|uniref:(2Fe-2S) ferredoxin domain-containing protein n=1 Tax=Pantanalinema rosaneae TaxID=1620701 RepID=UPI003D6E41EE